MPPTQLELLFFESYLRDYRLEAQSRQIIDAEYGFIKPFVVTPANILDEYV